MSYNNFGYPGYGYAPPAQSQQVPPAGFGTQQVPAPPATNKIYVVSAEDAMSRYAQPNTVMLYVQQDESAIYEVYTDGQGKKAIRARRLTDAPAENKGGEFVTRGEFDSLKAMVEKICGRTEGGDNA